MFNIRKLYKFKTTFNFSTSPITLNNNFNVSTPLTKTCCVKEKVVELGQPTHWTHAHLFDPPQPNETRQNQQVTPGITKQEFELRRDNYVNHLVNYQMFYFSSKLSGGEKKRLHGGSPSSWTMDGFDRLTSDQNFIAVIPSCLNSFMAPDVPNTFKQNSDFLYLTGFKEPDSVLVISRTDIDALQGKYKVAVFAREKNEKTELWEGPCTGPANIHKLCGIENAYALSEFRNYLNSLIKETSVNRKISLWRYPTESVQSESGPNCYNEKIETELDEFLREQLATGNKLIDMNGQEYLDGSVSASYYNSSRYFVQLCRVKKSRAEIEIMRRACDISSEAFVNSMRITHPLINEGLIYSKFDYDCKIRGADYLAYIPVIAGGDRATILHYIRNNQIVSNGSLLLMDAGCQYRDYASDITRTWPIGGKFNSPQRELYQACLNVQLHCLEHCLPGTTIQRLYNLMMRKMGEELSNLGLMDKKEFESVTSRNDSEYDRLPMYYLKKLSAFCPHDVGHYLGLDVHDCPEVAKSLPLEESSVITIEPGIYIRSDNTTVPERYRGIGIRIEDDVMISNGKCDVLSKKCPKTIDELEKILKG